MTITLPMKFEPIFRRLLPLCVCLVKTGLVRKVEIIYHLREKTHPYGTLVSAFEKTHFTFRVKWKKEKRYPPFVKRLLEGKRVLNDRICKRRKI